MPFRNDKQRKGFWASKQPRKIRSTDFSETTKTAYVKGGLSITKGPWVEAGYQVETTDEELDKFASEKARTFRID